jgi:hypothetical protein
MRVILKLCKGSEVFTVVTMKNVSSGMLHHVGLIRTEVLEERVASVFTFLHLKIYLS